MRRAGHRGMSPLLAGLIALIVIAVDTRTPGSQGPTFKGRPRIPAGQSFSSEPNGSAPPVLP